MPKYIATKFSGEKVEIKAKTIEHAMTVGCNVPSIQTIQRAGYRTKGRKSVPYRKHTVRVAPTLK